MRNFARCRLSALFAAVTLLGQAPSNVKIDSPQARVLVVTEQPHHRSALHEHPMNRVMIYLGSGQVIRTTAAGVVEKIEFKAGEPFRIVKIELKNKPQSPVKLSAIDPLKADPKHYSLEFENDQVRVLRVRFGPHEKGVLHEHKLNHIVVYLPDQAKGKAGEVPLAEPMTHTEENPLDHPVERIAV